MGIFKVSYHIITSSLARCLLIFLCFLSQKKKKGEGKKRKEKVHWYHLLPPVLINFCFLLSK